MENCNCNNPQAWVACLHNAWQCLCCDMHIGKPSKHEHREAQ